MVDTPIKADELAALAAATSLCCADATVEYVAKKKAGGHPAASLDEGRKVKSCFEEVRKQLSGGPCQKLYESHVACVEQAGWRDSVASCKETRREVASCAVQNRYGELNIPPHAEKEFLFGAMKGKIDHSTAAGQKLYAKLQEQVEKATTKTTMMDTDPAYPGHVAERNKKLAEMFPSKKAAGE